MRCFAIMPYGKTEQEKKEYSRIYKLLIRSAVEDMGLECVRSDIEGRGGHILSNVLEDLAFSDLVIADLSDLNWNVAYELGVRHVLHKNGTILICNEKDRPDLPFDVQSLNIFFYANDWLDKMEELCEQLKKIIEGRLNRITKADSPVHEKYSFLPDSVIEGYGKDADSSLKEAKARISELEKELADTYAKIDAMGLSLSAEQEDVIDYQKEFLIELENSIYNGDAAVTKLRELLGSGKKEEFLSFLGKVLSVGFLTESNCRSIYIMLLNLDVPAITRKYLETVTKFYPENDELFGFLANAYSQNYHTGDKALQMVNGIVGVSKKDGAFVLSKTARFSFNKLASFFDVYIHLNKEADLVEVGKLLAAKVAENKDLYSLVLRNLLTSYIELGDFTSAYECKERLLEAAPLDDRTYRKCAYLESRAENYSESIKAMEISIHLDPRDVDHYFAMAGYICDDMYARDPDTMKIRKIGPQEVVACVVPFLLSALTIDKSCAQRAVDFLRRNKMDEYIDPIVEAYKQGVNDFRSLFADLDMAAVNYCLNLEM